MMNLILSYLVCIAMLLSGGAELPAQPETATVRTIRNLTITTGEDSLTLTPELRLTTAIGGEAALAQLEVVDGEKTLLPMSGELTRDAFRFSLSESGNVYTISDGALLELMGADAEDLQSMLSMTDAMTGYVSLLGKMMADPEAQQSFSTTIYELLISSCGVSEEDSTVEIGGAQVPARRAHLELTAESTLNLLDALADCGIPELEAILDSYVQFMAAMMGEDCADVQAFTAALREELAEEGATDDLCLPMDITYTTQAPMHAAVEMDFILDGATLRLAVSSTSTAEASDVDMTMVLGMSDGEDSGRQFDIRLTEHVDGPLNAPEGVQLKIYYSMQGNMAWEYAGTDDDPAPILCSNTRIADAALEMNAVIEDGLEQNTAKFTAERNFTYDYDGDVTVVESALNAAFNTNDRREDDGSVTTSVAMDFDMDGDTLGISYELNRAEGVAVPDFGDGQSYDLMEIFEEEENGPGSVALMADVLKLGSDLAALGANDSVLALMEKMGVDPSDLIEELTTVDSTEDYACYVDDSEIYEDDDSYSEDSEIYEDVYDDGEDWSGDYVRVESLEAAAQVYSGTIPSFTLPDDLAPDGGMVIESYLTMDYSSAAEERGAQLICVCSDSDDTAYYAYSGGTLTPAEGMVQLGTIDGESAIHCISVSVGDDNFYFYLYGLSREEAEAVLASIQF